LTCSGVRYCFAGMAIGVVICATRFLPCYAGLGTCTLEWSIRSIGRSYQTICRVVRVRLGVLSRYSPTRHLQHHPAAGPIIVIVSPQEKHGIWMRLTGSGSLLRGPILPLSLPSFTCRQPSVDTEFLIDVIFQAVFPDSAGKTDAFRHLGDLPAFPACPPVRGEEKFRVHPGASRKLSVHISRIVSRGLYRRE